jgi:Zn-finger protein
MIPNSYRYFENRECRYYPCHKGIEHMNCLFCFCPLYPFDDCGGDYTLTKKGIKECSACIRPHLPENYDLVMEVLKRHLPSKSDQCER